MRESRRVSARAAVVGTGTPRSREMGVTEVLLPAPH